MYVNSTNEISSISTGLALRASLCIFGAFGFWFYAGTNWVVYTLLATLMLGGFILSLAYIYLSYLYLSGESDEQEPPVIVDSAPKPIPAAPDSLSGFVRTETGTWKRADNVIVEEKPQNQPAQPKTTPQQANREAVYAGHRT